MEEQLEKMRQAVYGKDSRGQKIMTVVFIAIVLIVALLFFVIKNRMDYDENSKNLDKYAREYYNENMKSANPGAAYAVNLKMLEASSKYKLKYFQKCDKKDTYVDIFVDSKGDITDTKVYIKC